MMAYTYLRCKYSVIVSPLEVHDIHCCMSGRLELNSLKSFTEFSFCQFSLNFVILAIFQGFTSD